MRNNRGSTILAALGFAFIVLLLTTMMLGRVASSYFQVTSRHATSSALFLAEAGINKAGQTLTTNPNYSGETGTRLETGYFDVKVARAGRGYQVVSTGYANSATAKKPKNTVRATIIVEGDRFRVVDWRASR